MSNNGCLNRITRQTYNYAVQTQMHIAKPAVPNNFSCIIRPDNEEQGKIKENFTFQTKCNNIMHVIIRKKRLLTQKRTQLLRAKLTKTTAPSLNETNTCCYLLYFLSEMYTKNSAIIDALEFATPYHQQGIRE
jgi:hypothetical protein